MSVFVILYVHFEFGTLSFSNSCGFFQLFLVVLDLFLVLRNLLFEFFNLALQVCNCISHLVDVARRYNSLPGVTRTVALALFKVVIASVISSMSRESTTAFLESRARSLSHS